MDEEILKPDSFGSIRASIRMAGGADLNAFRLVYRRSDGPDAVPLVLVSTRHDVSATRHSWIGSLVERFTRWPVWPCAQCSGWRHRPLASWPLFGLYA